MLVILGPDFVAYVAVAWWKRWFKKVGVLDLDLDYIPFLHFDLVFVGVSDALYFCFYASFMAVF